MLIDTNKTLTTIKGEPLTDVEGGKPVILGDAIAQALLAQVQGDDTSGAEKHKRFKLAMKLSAAELPVDVTVEEAAKIKEVVGKVFAPLVVGQVWDAIESAASAAGPGKVLKGGKA